MFPNEVIYTFLNKNERKKKIKGHKEKNMKDNFSISNKEKNRFLLFFTGKIMFLIIQRNFL